MMGAEGVFTDVMIQVLCSCVGIEVMVIYSLVTARCCVHQGDYYQTSALQLS